MNVLLQNVNFLLPSSLYLEVYPTLSASAYIRYTHVKQYYSKSQLLDCLYHILSPSSNLLNVTIRREDIKMQQGKILLFCCIYDGFCDLLTPQKAERVITKNSQAFSVLRHNRIISTTCCEFHQLCS